MTSYEFGDIILVSFPFTDQTASKKRPAVVVSSKAYHDEQPDLVLMAITSQPRPQGTVGEVVVSQWQKAGLLKPSVIKPVLATIERGLVLRKLGKLEAADRKALQLALSTILGQ